MLFGRYLLMGYGKRFLGIAYVCCLLVARIRHMYAFFLYLTRYSFMKLCMFLLKVYVHIYNVYRHSLYISLLKFVT